MISAIHKPQWLTIRPPTNQFHEVKNILRKHELVTVCEEAHCPNMSECWSGGTATFMILGDTCTRGCQFCAIKSAKIGRAVDQDEPRKLASAIKEMGIIDYVVITSVDRDDLEDQGASHFAACISEVKRQVPGILVEVLIPDFRGNKDAIETIISGKPDVIAHNVETVERLQGKVRDRRANYIQSLQVLQYVKQINPEIITKSSVMLGLGERQDEIEKAMDDLRIHEVDVVTFGQYLKPKNCSLQVQEYVRPELFEAYKNTALRKGFLYCASGPFVRSSYKAGEYFLKHHIDTRGAA